MVAEAVVHQLQDELKKMRDERQEERNIIIVQVSHEDSYKLGKANGLPVRSLAVVLLVQFFQLFLLHYTWKFYYSQENDCCGAAYEAMLPIWRYLWRDDHVWSCMIIVCHIGLLVVAERGKAKGNFDCFAFSISVFVCSRRT